MRSRPWLLVFLFCFSVVASLATAKFLQISALIAYAESFPPENQSISTVEVKSATFKPSVLLSGQTIAPNDIHLVAEVSGRIVSVGGVSGGKASPNQVLLQLDDSEEQASLKAAEAKLKLAEISLQRSESLRDKSLNSKEQLDIARAQKSAALADIELLEALIRKKKVISPFEGRISLHNFKIGEYISSGQKLFRVTEQGETIWIDFKLPQTLLEPALGAKVEIYSSDDRLIGEAEVIASDAWIASDTRNKNIRLAMPNMSSKLVSGTFVKVKIPTAAEQPALSVPTTSVRRDKEGAFVYSIIDSEEGAFLPYRASQKRVSILQQNANSFIVTGDIQAGEKIASLGAFKLKDNVFVNISAVSAGE